MRSEYNYSDNHNHNHTQKKARMSESRAHSVPQQKTNIPAKRDQENREKMIEKVSARKSMFGKSM